MDFLLIEQVGIKPRPLAKPRFYGHAVIPFVLYFLPFQLLNLSKQLHL
jgi:hypothetical protein